MITDFPCSPCSFVYVDQHSFLTLPFQCSSEHYWCCVIGLTWSNIETAWVIAGNRFNGAVCDGS
jgi:hypothetical protein